nr:MAG: hypothetical protein DIU78_01915 [Pseudomonadota bacterium]
MAPRGPFSLSSHRTFDLDAVFAVFSAAFLAGQNETGRVGACRHDPFACSFVVRQPGDSMIG